MDFLVPTLPDLVDRQAPADDLSTDRLVRMMLLHQTIELGRELQGGVTGQQCLHARPVRARDQVADGPEQSEVEMAERRHDRAHNPQVLV